MSWKKLCSGMAMLSVLAWLGCKPEGTGTNSSATDTNRQVFEVKGTLKSIKPNGRTAEIAHEEIPDYMPAMTMDLDVKDTNELKGLYPGDYLAFRMVVTKDDGWIENLRRLPPPAPTNATNRILLPGTSSTNPVSFRRAPNVQPLEVGDVIPDYKFTNQLGQPISLAQFRGQALGLTFIFTRCPFPTYCPRMSSQFQKAQTALLKPNMPTNWSLLSITIDPEFDTPERLGKHAQQYDSDPKRWHWVTSDLWNIDAITEQFGLTFYRETPNALPNHNLRTVVIDTKGRVQKVFVGNEWSAEELTEEIAKAAAVK
jgi:protein SCO1